MIIKSIKKSETKDKPSPDSQGFHVQQIFNKYCSIDEQCPETWDLLIGKSPWQICIETSCEDEFIGQEVDFFFEILNEEKKLIYDYSWTAKLVYKYQITRLEYKELPDPIKNILKGEYLCNVAAITQSDVSSTYWLLMDAISPIDE